MSKAQAQEWTLSTRTINITGDSLRNEQEQAVIKTQDGLLTYLKNQTQQTLQNDLTLPGDSVWLSGSLILATHFASASTRYLDVYQFADNSSIQVWQSSVAEL